MKKNQEEEIFDSPCDRPVHTVRGGPVLALRPRRKQYQASLRCSRMR